MLFQVVCIFAICGKCKNRELPRIKLEDIEHYDDILLVRIQETKLNCVRSFTITGKLYSIVLQYAALRPENMNDISTRFFINYEHGKCTAKVIRESKFLQMARRVATYLSLLKPETYTGMCC